MTNRKEARMDKAKRSYNRAIITLVLLLVVLLCSLSAYSAKLRSDITDAAFQNMEQILSQQSASFHSHIENDLLSVRHLTHTLSYLQPSEDARKTFLRDLQKNSNFDQILLVQRNGKGLNHEGEPVDLRGNALFSALMEGKSGVFAPTELTGTPLLLPIAAPFYIKGEVSGALIAGYNAEKLAQLLPLPYAGESDLFITDKSGQILIRAVDAKASETTDAPKNVLDILQNTRFLSYDNSQQMQENLFNHRAGRTTFDWENTTTLLCYMPIASSDWIMVLQLPEDVLAGQSQELTKHAIFLTTCILLIFFHLVAYVLWEQGGSNRERERHAEQLEHLAYYDALTGLPNLPQFKRLAEARLRRGGTNRFLLLKMDVVNFKVVNEIFGFSTADRALKLLAEEISNNGTDNSLISARINSDEFILLKQLGAGTQEEVATFLRFETRFFERVKEFLGGHHLELRYGRYLFTPGEDSIDVLIERVNLAHYSVRGKKGDNICDYDEDMRKSALKEVDLGNKMNRALERNEYQVYLQPKISLQSERIVGAEALVRWREPDSEELMSPSDFLPLFERNGFITKLDLYMFEQICKLLRQWMDAKQALIPISVNFSRLHLGNPLLTEELATLAEHYGIPKQYIIIELTESVIYEHEEALETLLLKLHALGFGVSMDDFGTGYSSLGLLKNLRVDEIKIDSSFFGGEQDHARAKIVLCSVVAMAKRLGIATVVEGVENREQVEFLQRAGCDMVQGYYYATPVPSKHFCKRFDIQIHPVQMEAPIALSKLGDLQKGRASLGKQMPLVVYRLLRSVVRRGLSELYGEGEMRETLWESGMIAGRALARETLDLHLSPDAFMENLLQEMARCNLGDFQLEWQDTTGKSMLFVSENRLIVDTKEDPSMRVCQYESGLLAGIFYEYTGKEYLVRELSCRCTGASHCRFELREK